jgi:cytochrome bd ubiquinol oxidase subunit II
MSQQTLATLAAILVGVVLVAYAVLGGADFGGGIWDLLATGPMAARERSAIARAMGPVWESNNIWLIFVLVITWTAFPIVFAGVSTALFIPITLALIGIVLRGAAFSFRSNYGMEVGAGLAWGRAFSGASVITPFLLGTVAGALASGSIRVTSPPLQVQANIWTTWTTPFALACGLFAVGLCSVLAATYLSVDSRNTGDEVLTQLFRQRAIVAGAVTAVLGAVAAVLAISEAPVLWNGLTGRALPISVAAVLLGLTTAAALLTNSYLAARVLVAGETLCILAAWGVAQWPYLIVPNVTVQNAASPASVLGPMLIVAVLGLVILIPALVYLFYIFKRRATPGGPAIGPSATTASFVATLQPADDPTPVPNTAQASAVFSLPATVPGASLLERMEPLLAFSLAVGAAVVTTGVSDVLRTRLRTRVERRRRRTRGQADMR